MITMIKNFIVMLLMIFIAFSISANGVRISKSMKVRSCSQLDIQLDVCKDKSYEVIEMEIE